MASQFKTFTVRRTGRTFGVFYGHELVEGGFFSRAAAEECAADYRADLAEAGERAAGWDASA